MRTAQVTWASRKANNSADYIPTSQSVPIGANTTPTNPQNTASVQSNLDRDQSHATIQSNHLHSPGGELILKLPQVHLPLGLHLTHLSQHQRRPHLMRPHPYEYHTNQLQVQSYRFNLKLSLQPNFKFNHSVSPTCARMHRMEIISELGM